MSRNRVWKILMQIYWEFNVSIHKTEAKVEFALSPLQMHLILKNQGFFYGVFKTNPQISVCGLDMWPVVLLTKMKVTKKLLIISTDTFFSYLIFVHCSSLSAYIISLSKDSHKKVGSLETQSNILLYTILAGLWQHKIYQLLWFSIAVLC